MQQLIEKYQQRIKHIDANRRHYNSWTLTQTRIEKEILLKVIKDLQEAEPGGGYALRKVTDCFAEMFGDKKCEQKCEACSKFSDRNKPGPEPIKIAQRCQWPLCSCNTICRVTKAPMTNEY